MAELPAPKINESGGHWYTLDGQPAYEVAKADGSGTRSTTVKDARKLELFPSVTNVLGVCEKPQLTLWKVKTAVRCALAVPRLDGEEEEAWVGRVLDRAAEPVAEAADLGSRIHEAIETACGGGTWDTQALGAYVAPVLAWILGKLSQGGRVVAQEAVIVNAAEGYAGKVDFAIEMPDGTVWVVDWKSRKTRAAETDRQAFTPYDTQGMQLAAYAAEWAVTQGRGWDKVRCANVMTSSTEPGRFFVAEHADPQAAFEAFRHLLGFWRWRMKYDPRRPSAA